MKNKKHLEIPPLPTKASNSKCFGGFTLAETLIVLVVLGIVASITIPPLVRRQIEASNRVKIKKAMGVYETMLAKIAVENDLKSNAALKEWGEQGGECANQRNYFKAVKGGGCQFMTTDKVWWDVEDITHPKIALKEGELDKPDSKTTFQLLGHFGANGELRVDDLAYEEQHATGADLIAIMNLYSFINNDESKKINVGSMNFINMLGYDFSEYEITNIEYDEQGRITKIYYNDQWNYELSLNYNDESQEILTTREGGPATGLRPRPGQGGGNICRSFSGGRGEVYDYNANFLYVALIRNGEVMGKCDGDGNPISTTTTANENSNSGNSGSGRLLQ